MSKLLKQALNESPMGSRPPIVRTMADRMCARKIAELAASERSLEKKVLAYLQRHGPKKWVKVYRHFDHGALGEIGPVLKLLASLKQIDVEELGYIQITRAGINRITKGRQDRTHEVPSISVNDRLDFPRELRD